MALPILSTLQAFQSTPTIYWSCPTGFAFPRHTGGITERAEKKNLVLFWKHSQPKQQFHCPAALPMMQWPLDMSCNCVQSLSEHHAWAALTSHALGLRNVLTATTSLHLLRLGTAVTSIPEQDREAPVYSFPDIIWLSRVMTDLTKALLRNMETFQTSCSNAHFNVCIIAAVSLS